MNLNKFLILLLSFTYSLLPFTIKGNQNHNLIEIRNGSEKIQFATSINEFGEAVGMTTFQGKNYFYYWRKSLGTVLLDQFFMGYSYGPGLKMKPYINNNGRVSSFPITDQGDEYTISTSKVLLKNHLPVEDTHEWDSIYGIRVNNNGKILGLVKQKNGKESIAIYDTKDKTFTYINSPVKYRLTPVDINENDWIICLYHDFHNYHGLLWIPEVGPLVLENFLPTALNNMGQIVGITKSDQKPLFHLGFPLENRAVIWRYGTVTDISKELNLKKDLSNNMLWISYISDINDKGEMVGWGVDVNNQQQAVFIELKN